MFAFIILFVLCVGMKRLRGSSQTGRKENCANPTRVTQIDTQCSTASKAGVERPWLHTNQYQDAMDVYKINLSPLATLPIHFLFTPLDCQPALWSPVTIFMYFLPAEGKKHFILIVLNLLLLSCKSRLFIQMIQNFQITCAPCQYWQSLTSTLPRCSAQHGALAAAARGLPP